MQHLSVMAAAAPCHSQLQFAKASDTLERRRRSFSQGCKHDGFAEGRVCVCRAGAITTLGRGGSDLSATVIGAALNLAEVQVWKDVDGKQLDIRMPAVVTEVC